MTLRISPEPWAARAACLGSDPDMFFPEVGAAKVARKAQAICNQCCVRNECLTYAQTHQIQWGIWGGLTAKAREKAHARTRIPGQCLNGHIYTDRTSYINNEGHLRCRICRRGFLTDDPPTKGLAGTGRI